MAKVARPRNKLLLIISVRPIAPPWLGLRFPVYMSRQGDPGQDLLDSLSQHRMLKIESDTFSRESPGNQSIDIRLSRLTRLVSMAKPL